MFIAHIDEMISFRNFNRFYIFVIMQVLCSYCVYACFKNPWQRTGIQLVDIYIPVLTKKLDTKRGLK
jgi:hypothetical protein